MVPYDTLMTALGVDTVRDLEDILIETIYSVVLLYGWLQRKACGQSLTSVLDD